MKKPEKRDFIARGAQQRARNLGAPRPAHQPRIGCKTFG